MEVNMDRVVDALRGIAQAKSLDSEEVGELLREAMEAGLESIYGATVQSDVVVDGDSGEIEMFILKQVVEEVKDEACEISLTEARWDDEGYQVGDLMEIPVELSDFTLTAVRSAKERIVSRVRERENQQIMDLFADRVGELLSGTVHQIDRGKTVLLLNQTRRADAIIPRKELNPRERFRRGESIRAVLKKVDETPMGPKLILSRADPSFVAALFRLEVPEIYQGIVTIKGIAREVGGRTKIAVHSHDEAIDPVGACVGMRGSRVQAVVKELGGSERIDIVPWHPDTDVYARRALAPAVVSKVYMNRESQVITAIVGEDQLSLAIGRNGQNVRLASQLLGWQVDLYGSREWMELGSPEIDDRRATTEDMSDFPISELNLAKETLSALNAAGYATFFDIIDLDMSDLLAVEGIEKPVATEVVRLIEGLTVEADSAE